MSPVQESLEINTLSALTVRNDPFLEVTAHTSVGLATLPGTWQTAVDPARLVDRMSIEARSSLPPHARP